MNRQKEIILQLERVDQLIDPPSPFLKRRLREDAEKYFIEKARAARHKSDMKFILRLPESEAAQAKDVPTAFREHFAFRRDEAEKERRRIRSFGLRSLLIAFVFLGIMILIVEIIKRYVPAGNLSSVLQEGLTILAWVALWRPGELLLYEWYPFKRDARLFGRLEHAEIQIVAEAKDAKEMIR
jgi:hypothetical protein